ncbi:hypothetical protein L9F63_016239, partial [Diploptera punctata]
QFLLANLYQMTTSQTSFQSLPLIRFSRAVFLNVQCLSALYYVVSDLIISPELVLLLGWNYSLTALDRRDTAFKYSMVTGIVDIVIVVCGVVQYYIGLRLKTIILNSHLPLPFLTAMTELINATVTSGVIFYRCLLYEG